MVSLLLPAVHAQRPAPPRIAAETRVIDFGEAGEGQTLPFTFTLRNEGQRLLRISQVQTDCGCTASSLSQRELPSGESATLNVELDLRGRTGPQLQRIHIRSNDPENPVYTLTLQGTAVPAVEIEPRMIHFQRVDPAQMPSQTIGVTRRQGPPLEILRLHARRGQLDTRLEVITPGEAYRIHVTPHPPETEGHFSDVLEIHTNREGLGQQSVVVMWQLTPPVTFAPAAISLRLAPGQPPVTQHIFVRGSEELTQPLQVLSALWPGREDIVLGVQDTGRFGWRITLENVVPVAEMHREAIVIQTNIPGFERIEVPVRVQQ